MSSIELYKPQGIDIALNILQSTSKMKFLIYYDPDIDGVVSGELIRRMLIKLGLSFEYTINENRQHGFKLSRDLWANYIGYTIFLVDSSIDEKTLKELVDYGINIINIDHHDRQEQQLVSYFGSNASGVIINNNYSFEPTEWKYLSGGGMVYYFIRNLFPDMQTNEEEALVGLTLLSDIRSLDDYTAKQFLHELYNAWTPFIQYLIDLTKPDYDFGYGQYTMDRNYIDYTFSPKVNALFRANRGDLAVKLFSWEAEESLRDVMTVSREMQKKMVEFIKSNIDYKISGNIVYATIPVYIRNLWGLDMTNYIGITCSDILNRGKTTIICVVDENNNIVRGSLRGLCSDVQYLDIIREHGADAMGHQGAFGIIKFNPNQETLDSIDKTYGDRERGYETRKYLGKIHEVTNLKFFTLGDELQKIANYNNYVRDNQRSYIKYTGDINTVNVVKHGKKIEHIIDGIPVLCFDEELTVENSLILPIFERNKVITLFMHRI